MSGMRLKESLAIIAISLVIGSLLTLAVFNLSHTQETYETVKEPAQEKRGREADLSQVREGSHVIRPRVGRDALKDIILILRKHSRSEDAFRELNYFPSLLKVTNPILCFSNSSII